MKHTTYKTLSEMVKKYVDEDNSMLLTDAYKADGLVYKKKILMKMEMM